MYAVLNSTLGERHEEAAHRLCVEMGLFDTLQTVFPFYSVDLINKLVKNNYTHMFIGQTLT